MTKYEIVTPDQVIATSTSWANGCWHSREISAAANLIPSTTRRC